MPPGKLVGEPAEDPFTVKPIGQHLTLVRLQENDGLVKGLYGMFQSLNFGFVLEWFKLEFMIEEFGNRIRF